MASRHYRIPTPDEPVGQGDIFLDIPVPVTLFDKQLVWDEDRAVYREEAIRGELTAGILLLTRVEIKHAIVIDQSCDAPGSTRVLFAPLFPYKPEGKEDAQWKDISALATSLRNPTRFYLPDEPSVSLGRHLAEFEDKFDLPGHLIARLIREGKRVLALSQEALGFLQFRLGTMYARYARDDYAWPSVADLKLKQAYLKKQIESKEGDVRGWRNKVEKAETLPTEKDHLLAKIAVHEPKIEEWKLELSTCERNISSQETPPVAVGAMLPPTASDVADLDQTTAQQSDRVQPQTRSVDIRFEALPVPGGDLSEGARVIRTVPEQLIPGPEDERAQTEKEKVEPEDTGGTL